jgi:hypothetical protein
MTKNSKSRSDNATELTAVNFKHFVEELLGAMNYEDAQVTKWETIRASTQRHGQPLG